MEEKSRKRGQSSDLVRLPYFDWDKTKYFYYISKLGSFLEAGRFLNVSQSALSRKIAALESHINAQLFYRQSRGVQLTPVGEQLFIIVERTFYEMKEFAHSISIKNSTNERVIRVASTEPVCDYILGDLLIEYNLLHPTIRFEIVGEKYQIDSEVCNFDVALRPEKSQTENFIHEELFCFEKRLFASSSYLEQFGTPQCVEDLKNHRLISIETNDPEKFPYADVYWILKLGKPKGQLHKAYFSSNCLKIMINAAAQGIGIVASYDQFSLVKNDKNLVNILPDTFKREDPFYLTYPKYLKDDPKIVDLLAFLRSRLAQAVTV